MAGQRSDPAAVSVISLTTGIAAAVVAVVTALYPAATVLLARLTLAEQWSRPQQVGLAICALAVAAISLG